VLECADTIVICGKAAAVFRGSGATGKTNLAQPELAQTDGAKSCAARA
jgi:hypothetical protein